MKYKIFIYIAILMVVLTGCKKKYHVDSGRMKFTYLMIKNASNEASEEAVKLDISTVYFKGNSFIEVLPEYYTHESNEGAYNIIKDGNYINVPTLDFAWEDFKSKGKSVENKKSGITFFEQELEGKFEASTDTILNKKKYKRFILNTEKYYSVYYLEITDSLLPFKLNKELESKGILSRIDTYEKEEDIFTSLKMSLSDTITKQEFGVLKRMNDEW